MANKFNIFRKDYTFQHYQSLPLQKLAEASTITGRNFTSEVIVMVMQYGPNFSGPGKDVFMESRSTANPHQAHKSNFLHPVLYYYKELPTG